MHAPEALCLIIYTSQVRKINMYELFNTVVQQIMLKDFDDSLWSRWTDFTVTEAFDIKTNIYFYKY
jgi:hypothetical protein